MSTVTQARTTAKAQTNKEFLAADPEDFSTELQQLLAQQREIHDAFRAKKAEILERVREEMICEPGRQPVGTGYTRWGQWFVVVDDKPAPKVPVVKCKTYAAYRAHVEAEGRNA
jgi:hypothetical protein